MILINDIVNWFQSKTKDQSIWALWKQLIHAAAASIFFLCMHIFSNSPSYG